jgi:hypothetical protein
MTVGMCRRLEFKCLLHKSRYIYMAFSTSSIILHVTYIRHLEQRGYLILDKNNSTNRSPMQKVPEATVVSKSVKNTETRALTW